MTNNYIWVKNKKYYLYDTCNTWEKALKIAKAKRKKNKCRYFIKVSKGGEIIFPSNKYKLYLDKCIKLF